jgi:Zn-dependent protease/CBS domain-containing protein
MGGSIKLFRIRGIDLRMHITFPLILIWAGLQYGPLSGGGVRGAVFGVLVTLVLFVIVILHELGHSIAAQRYDVPVKQIVLLPIGGVAQMAHIPEQPIKEFVIAIAGPLVNFGLAIVFGIVALAAGFRIGLDRMPAILSEMRGFNAQAVFTYVFASNLFLGLFNLLPAFPMDGGRVLRALLAMRLPYRRATATAVSIGQGLAWVLGLWGFLGGGFFLILIAVFIYLGAGQEGQLVRLRSVLGGLTVRQAYSREPRALSPDSTLRDAVELTLNSFQADFPVCDGEQLVGILTHAKLVEALNTSRPEKLVREVMLTDFPTVELDDGLMSAQQRLLEGRFDALPVLEQGRFRGLITSRDVNEIYRLASSREDLLPERITAQEEALPIQRAPR